MIRFREIRHAHRIAARPLIRRTPARANHRDPIPNGWGTLPLTLENGEAAAALPELEEAAAMAEKFLPPEHPQLKETHKTLMNCKEAIEAGRVK